MAIKLSPAMLKKLIAEEVRNINEEQEEGDASDKLIDYLKAVKIKESKIRAIRDRAERELKQLAEAKQRATKKLLKKI
jgi:hypothetical protein